MTLADLFPDEDYTFHARFERGGVAEFFRPTPRHAALTAERREWLRGAPQTCAALQPDGTPLLEETIALARSEQTLPDGAAIGSSDPWERCLELGICWEPDYLLLKWCDDGEIRLVAGCLCFPSSWSLAEKIGRPIEAIHGVVPGLNAAIGNQIHTFLGKLRPGAAWLRANWGLSRSPELNQHPERKLPRLDAHVTVDEVWLRVEYQALVALPRTRGVLFGIRIAVHPLAEVIHDDAIAPRLRRALQTMPEEMARYKNIASARERITGFLGG